MEGAQAKGRGEAETALRFGARHEVTGVLRGVPVRPPIVKIPRPPRGRFRNRLDDGNGEQGWVAICAETNFAAPENGSVGERMKGSVGTPVVSAPDGQGCLSHVDVAPLARGERTPRANCRGVQAAFHDVNRVDIAQQKPNLNHVPGFGVVGFHGCDGDECETFLGFAFVNDVTCSFFHDVYWLVTGWNFQIL